ncbi:MAG TPA: hypothetical protein PKH81_01370 [Treponemataceae bacterium]|nr:hypothetical protein [Treponemataceae bacterium]
MPLKFLVFMIVMVFVAFFIGFNLENRCDISIVFHTYHDVPVVLSVLCAFILGVLVSGFSLLSSRKSPRKDQKPVKPSKKTPYGID